MQDSISFGQAFSHCLTVGSYWIWLIICTAISAALVVIMLKRYRKNQEVSMGDIGLLFIAAAVFFAGVFAKPSSECANTTKEMAAQGIYIG